MRIIKRGLKPEKNIERLKKCRVCKTVFAYTSKDLQEFGYDAYTWHFGVICPVCENYLSKSIFDKKVKKKS